MIRCVKYYFFSTHTALFSFKHIFGQRKIAEDDFAPQAIITIAEMDTALAEDLHNDSPDKLYVKSARIE